MDGFKKLLGVLLMLAGIYFLGQNIFFTTFHSGFSYGWRSIPAAGSVFTLLGGIFTLVFGRRSLHEVGWVLLGIGIVLVFVSGGVVLRPTSLWTFLLSFFLLAGGFKLTSDRRLGF
jgi:hypothetical protein